MTDDLNSLLFRPNEGDSVRVPKLNLLRTHLLAAETLLADPTIVAFGALVGAADKVPYFTGVDAMALADFPAFGRSLAAAIDAATGRSLLNAEAAIAAGTVAQYWRGDKSWQTLNAAAVAFAPTGGIAAVNVQTALAELDTEKLAASSYTAADVLAKLLTVDGAGSLLDADLLDAQSGAFYLARANHTGTQAWGTLTGTPTTLVGYGITDAQPLDTDLTAISALATQTYGRSLLTAVDAPAGRTLLGVTATGVDTTYAYRANNLSDLASASSARTNLGVTATGADTTYLFRTNNLSDLTNTATARSNLGLGSAAVKNIGTSGDTVPVLNGAATTWASPITVSTSGHEKHALRGSDYPNIGFYDSGGTQVGYVLGYSGGMDLHSIPGDIHLIINTATIGTVSSAGLDIVGLARCDSFRIDANPVSNPGVVATHTLAFSANGSVYHFLLTT